MKGFLRPPGKGEIATKWKIKNNCSLIPLELVMKGVDFLKEEMTLKILAVQKKVEDLTQNVYPTNLSFNQT